MRGIPKPWIGDGSYTAWLQTCGRIQWQVGEDLQRNGFNPLAICLPFAPPGVLISPTPEDLEHIWGPKTFHNFTKKIPFSNFKTLLGEGIFAVDGEKWVHQRKTTSLLFSSSIIKNFMGSVINTRMVELDAKIGRMITEAGSAVGATVAVGGLFHALTFDVIAEIAFGTDAGAIKSFPEEATLPAAFDRLQQRLSRRPSNPFWKIASLLSMYPEDTVKTDRKILTECIDRVVDAYDQNNDEGKADLLSVFRKRALKEKSTLTREMERDLVINFLLAGRDTTGITLTYMFLTVAQHPKVLAKILQEVDALDFDEKGFTPINRLAELRYVKATVMETLRLFPPVALNLFGVERDDVLPSGARVGEGSVIYVSTWAMARDERVWGPDASEFNPDRHNVTHEPSPYVFASFKGGPRMCLGKRLAMEEMIVTAHRLWRNYTFSFDKSPEDVTQDTGLTLKVVNEDTVMRITRRN